MIRLLRYDLLGFLIASRIPSLLIIGATQYLTAFCLLSPYPGKMADIQSIRFFLMSISTVLIAAAAYINNDYYDQKIDMVNRPDRVVVGTLFRRRLAILAHFLMTVLGIAVGFWLDPSVGVVHVASSTLLWYYSNRLRRIPLFGNLVISLVTTMVLLLVPIYLSRNEPVVYVYAIFAFSSVLMREVIKDIVDVKGDQRFGVQSVPVIWGVRGAKVFIGMVIVGSGSFLVSFLILIDNWALRYYYIGLIPVFLAFIYRLIVADQRQAYHALQKFANVIIFTGLISMLLLRL